MGKKGVASTGLALVVLSLLGAVCLSVFGELIRAKGWFDRDTAYTGAAILGLVGCALGWAGIKTFAGKVTAVLGTLLVLSFLIQLLWTSSPQNAPAAIAKPMNPQPSTRSAE